MSSARRIPFGACEELAIDEIRCLILQQYPAATFAVQRGQDDPEAIHLLVTVDLEDTDAVPDLVLEHMMELQIEQGTPIFVITARPTERVSAMHEAARSRQHLVDWRHV
jgi:hypothetical protein